MADDKDHFLIEGVGSNLVFPSIKYPSSRTLLPPIVIRPPTLQWSRIPRRKKLWFLVLLGCVTVMSFQVFDRVNHYRKQPKSLNIEFVKEKEITFPQISVCQGTTINLTAFRKMRQELAHKKTLNISTDDIRLHHLMYLATNVTDLWDKLMFSRESMIKECLIQGDLDCNKHGEWKKIPSMRGFCHSYVMNTTINQSLLGEEMTLRLGASITDSSSSWKILVHPQDDDPAGEIITKSFLISPFLTVDVRVRKREYVVMRGSKQPCNEMSQSQCWMKYFSEYLAAKQKCRFPFMESYVPHIPECTKPDDYLEVERVISKFIYSKHAMDSSCENKCTHMTYDLKVDSRLKPDSASNNETRIRFLFDEFAYERISEVPAYSVIALLCDIGGSLGLFLGASILSLMEVAEVVILTISSKCSKKREQGQEKSEEKKPVMKF